jgi:hypothetical protein
LATAPAGQRTRTNVIGGTPGSNEVSSRSIRPSGPVRNVTVNEAIVGMMPKRRASGPL